MSISFKLARFLKKHHVAYEHQSHADTFTSCETAEADHVPGRQFLKPVLVKADGKIVMAVIPSDRVLDWFKLSDFLGTCDLRIAEESEFRSLFPESESGAMPPFGYLYGIPTYADEKLWEEIFLYFNAGNHHETLKIRTSDFFRISKAEKGDFSVPREKMKAS